MQRIELLAPAGTLEKLKVALAFGANAVYIGGKQYSLRARSSNFTIDDIKEAVEIANKYNASIYVTTNIIAHNDDLKNLEELKKYILKLEELGVRGIIVADIAIANIAKEITNNLEIHISTQLSTLNSEAVEFLKDYGVNRVVLGRECTFEQIKKIKENTDIELEVFIHGGMCMAISGKCVLSNYLTDRDANRGGCAHSCRWYYDVYDRNMVKVSEEKFTFSSKDLQAVDFIKNLVDIGVSSLKIEGRMKSEHYLGTIIGNYRQILDDVYKNKKIKTKKYLKEMSKAENRPTSTGFMAGRASINEQIYSKESEIPSQEFVAKVLEYDRNTRIVKIEQRNHFSIKQKLEVFGPNKKNIRIKIRKMYNEKGEDVDIARHAKEILYFKSNIPLELYDMIRIIK